GPTYLRLPEAPAAASPVATQSIPIAVLVTAQESGPIVRLVDFLRTVIAVVAAIRAAVATFTPRFEAPAVLAVVESPVVAVVVARRHRHGRPDQCTTAAPGRA